MIVVDTSILVPAFVVAPDTAEAKRLIDPKGQWMLPPLWRFEFTSAMVTLTRAGEIDQTTAHRAMEEARITVINREVPVDQGRVVRTALRLKISAYDAQYVTLAEEYDVLCVTADQELSAKARGRAVLLDDYIK